MSYWGGGGEGGKQQQQQKPCENKATGALGLGLGWEEGAEQGRGWRKASGAGLLLGVRRILSPLVVVALLMYSLLLKYLKVL